MTFDKALAEYKSVGASNAGDTALMAGYCQHVLQTIVGAVSPKLVFQGAMVTGITSAELARMSVNDPMAVSDLQWA